MSGIKSKQDKVIRCVAHAAMIFLAVLAIIPFWMMVASSFTSENALIKFGYNFWPREISLEAYQYILTEWGQIGRAYGMTLLVTVVGTVISLLLVSMAGTALAQENIPGMKAVFVLILITMLFNGGVVSSYIIYSQVFHIKDTIWALIVPNLLLNGFNVMLMRNYVKNTIPEELLEAAEMDGAGMFRIYFQMILPLSKPILATVGLLTAVGYWNDWTNGLYYVNDNKLNTIQLLLNQMNNNVQYLASHSDLGLAMQDVPTIGIRMSIAVIGILPIILLYPFFQKYFESGITMGAVKG